MRAMVTRVLRQWIARCMLLGFALALGVAAASPWIAPRAYQLVCSEGVVKLVALDDDAPADVPHGHQLECALCLLTFTPPADAPVVTAAPASVARASHWVRVDAPRVAGVWAPLPARGPPVQAA